MTLGNHDYRRVPYRLLFDAEIPVLPDHELKNFNPHNLTRADASAVQGGKPTLSSGDALEMVKPQDPTYFFVRLCRGDVGLGEASYTIKLGSHRIVMIDSKYDTGVLESSWDAFMLEVFGGDEQQRSFADGSPNQVGFTARHLDMVARSVRGWQRRRGHRRCTRSAVRHERIQGRSLLSRKRARYGGQEGRHRFSRQT